jgi:phenylalanyl-tRNA synthetase beta chain
LKILVSWLRDFVDVQVAAEELGRVLSMRGFELAAVEPVPGDLPARNGRAVSDGPDTVLDFEITANRPDCLSVFGIAREVATTYGLPLRAPSHDTQGALALRPLGPSPRDSDGLAVHVEDAALCPRYAAAVVDVSVGPSPAWLAGRLQAAGVRPINNVVDITNYVLMELGQPMHAFDLDALAGPELRIRRARSGESIRTLDGEHRTLTPDMLIIADAARPQAVAGIMGGALSEVGPGTRTIVLESACFDPRSVRRTSKQLALKTEASARFERGADIEAQVLGIERACALFEETGAGRARGSVIDRYASPAGRKLVRLRRTRIPRLLGQTVSDEDVARILSSLAFGVSEKPDGWEVTVPSARVDVAREVDLIEEVARHYGYDRLPVTFPPLDRPAPVPDPRIERDRLVRRVLAAAGVSEAVSFAFIEAGAADPFHRTADLVAIGNPLSAQFAVLRPSILPGLVAAVAHNRRHERRDVRLFEIGVCVTAGGARRRVGIAWTGDAAPAHWGGRPREVDFFDVKGIVERLCEALSCRASFSAGPVPDHFVRGRCAAVTAGTDLVGAFGQLVPAVAAAAGLPREDALYVAELDLDAVDRSLSTAAVRVRPLPRYPSIVRDISIVVDDTLPAEAVRGTIRSVGPDTLVSVREFDRYQGKGVPGGRTSLSLRLTFRSLERTLTDGDVQDAMDRVLAALVRKHNAVQR